MDALTQLECVRDDATHVSQRERTGATTRLLLVSCSATKRHDAGWLPALERYQGVVYRVIKKNRTPDLSIWIISAAFGLISERRLIPDYDLYLTPQRAREMEGMVSRKLDELLQLGNFTSIFVNLGASYALTLRASHLLPLARQRGQVLEARGGIGQRLQQTKHWLLSEENNRTAPPDEMLEPRCATERKSPQNIGKDQ